MAATRDGDRGTQQPGRTVDHPGQCHRSAGAEVGDPGVQPGIAPGTTGCTNTSRTPPQVRPTAKASSSL